MFPENRLMEVLIIGALALIVVGPKDLPILMRRVGQFVGKMRGMAAEFRASFDELARQSELDDLRKEVEALRRANPVEAFHPMADPSTAAIFNEINQGLGAQMTASGAGASAVPPAPVEAAPAPIEPAPETTAAETATPPEPAPKPKRAPRKPRAQASDVS
jgi:sec-independent protein translocase protein TatB